MLINGNMIDKNLWWVGFSHGSWFETTSSDIGYPIFLILLGISFKYSLESSIAKGQNDYFLKFFIRSLRLLVLGIILKALPSFSSLNLLGTLQCLAYSSLISAGVVKFFGRRSALASAAFITLFCFSLSIFTVDWNTRWNEGYTFFESVDLYFCGHTGGVEGIFTTLQAAGFILFGFGTGDFVRDSRLLSKSLLGGAMIGLGSLLHLFPDHSSVFWIPLVPRLFTLSFCLLAMGATILTLALFEVLIRLPGKRLLTQVLEPFGRNSILAYAGVIAFRKIFLQTCLIHCSGEHPSFREWIIFKLSQYVGASFAVYIFTITFLFLAWLICLQLYRRRIFIRI